MSILLDLTYMLLALIASPLILFKVATSRRWRSGVAQRLGGVARRTGRRPCVWIHAVSVGETNLSRSFIDLIQKEHPDWDVRVSTTTDTGQKLAVERYGAERCFYFPLDLSWAVRRTFDRVRPAAIVLIELEIWPNFIRTARARGVPVIIANGRMREKTLPRYRALRPLFRPLFDPQGPNLFCVQNETYRDRFVRAGFPPEKVRVTGNMKYDSVRTEVDPAKLEPLRQALGIAPGERVWIGACTWPGEEAICLRVHRQLQQAAPGLRLILAPRHIERADEVAREIEAAGYACRRRSRAAHGGAAAPGDAIGLLDTVGELGYLYSLAEFVFVGKSLLSQGGHNVLEPAALGVLPTFGPHMGNFPDEVRLLLDAGAAEQVTDEADLGRVLSGLLNDPVARQQRAARGREALRPHRGASRRHLDVLQSFMT